MKTEQSLYCNIMACFLFILGFKLSRFSAVVMQKVWSLSCSTGLGLGVGFVSCSLGLGLVARVSVLVLVL